MARLYNESHHQNQQKTLNLLFKVVIGLSMATLVLAVSLACYALFNKPQNHYFATNTNGVVMQLTPLDKPLVSQNVVSQFAVNSITQLLTFDFVNYRKQVNVLSSDFSEHAFRDVKTSLQGKQGLVTQAVKGRWVVSSVAVAAPQVIKTGVLGGVYTWKLQFPLQVTFHTGQAERTASYSATVMVIRTSCFNVPRGIVIGQLILTQKNGASAYE